MVQFNFTFDPGISLEQRVGFELAASIWGTYLTDDISVNLHIVSAETLEGDAIGGAVPLFHEQNYGVLNEYLEQDATASGDPNAPSTDEQVVESLQTGNTVDVLIDGEVVDGNSSVLLTSAQAKALDMDEAVTLDNGTTWDRDLVDPNALDGYIVINQSYDWNYDFLRTDNPQGQTLDFLSLALHEIGHQLGFVSGLDGLLDINQLYSGETQIDGFTLLDLFRHTADSQAINNPDGAVSDLTQGTDAMFSVNGGADGLALFSTGQDGDGFQAAHWKRMKDALGIMDPTLAYKERLNVTELDAQAMDALGYDVNYDAFNSGLNISALLLEAEMAVAGQMGLDGSVLAETRSNGYPDGEYDLNFAQWWQIFETQILELGYGNWWQLLELGYGFWFQQFGSGLLELGYGSWFQQFESGLLELGYGTWFQQFESALLELGYGQWFQQFESGLLELGYGNWWQLLELGYGQWFQQLETFFATLDTVGDTAGATLIDLQGLPDNSGEGIFVGGNEDDIIGGTEFQDRVAGGNGDDLIDGKEGDDVLWGDDGKDVLYGYDGNDVAYGGDGDDLLLGEQGDDQLLGGDGADVAVGGEGNDVVSGGKGRDDLEGGDGIDVISGGQGDDWVKGNGQDDLLMGNQGQDKLEGGEGNDVIYGDQDLGLQQSGLVTLLQQFLASRTNSDSDSSSPSGNTFEASANGLVRLEAEDMSLNGGYSAIQTGNASGSGFIQNWNEFAGTATADFSGPAGRYMMIVNYLDESDGQATATVKVNGIELDSWVFNQDNNQFTSRTVATDILLSEDDTIEIVGTGDAGEHALIDYIDFVSLDSLLPNSSDNSTDDSDDGSELEDFNENFDSDESLLEPTLLLQNGSFSDGLDNWNVDSGSPQVSQSDAYTERSLNLTSGDVVSQTFSVVAGNAYEISTFAKFSGSSWGGFGIDFYDINWQQISTNPFQVNNNSWKNYQAQVFAPENAYYASVWALNNDASSSNAKLLLDEVSVIESQTQGNGETATTTSSTVNDGLVAHWTFDESTGTTVTESLRNNSSALSNMTDAAWTTGIEGGALSFDGVDDSIYVEDASHLRLGDNNADFSVAFWLNLQSGPTGDHRALLHKWSSQNRLFGIWLDENSNRLRYSLSTTANSDTGNYSQAELALNQWTHVTYVKEGNQISLYLNGQFDSGMTLLGNTQSAEGLLQIIRGVNADLDDLRLYDRALSSSNIISLSKYNADFIEGGTGQDFLYGDEGDDIVYGESTNTFDEIAQANTIGAFNGTEAFIADHQDAMLLDQGTLAFSFQSDELLSQYLFSKDSSGYDDGGHLSINITGGRLQVRLQSTDNHYHLNSEVLNPGQNYDVAVTFGIRGLELWMDGQLVDTNSYTGGLGSSSGGSGNREPIVIGASQTYSDDLIANNLQDYFTGTIQNVRLLDQQLNGASIATLPVEAPVGANTVFEALVSDPSNNDTVVGGQGNDTLFGNLGDDILYGDSAQALINGFEYNGNFYLLTQDTDWHSAQTEAELLGGNLVTVNDVDEQNWLISTFGTTEALWIGFTDEADEGDWQWTNGETTTYDNWIPGRPDNYGGIQHYAFLNADADGGWNDTSINYTYRGIVEIELSNYGGNDVLTGGSGNDTLYGELGDDVLNGSSTQAAGAYEVDTLVGGQGADQFILGDSNQAYYQANGNLDYALIRDFSAAEDRLQLHGSLGIYTQQQQGSNLYLYFQGASAELIAIFENTASLDLNSVAVFV